jgi:hypothetical protein
MSFIIEGAKVRYNEPPAGDGPDGIVDGDEGEVLALVDNLDDGHSVWSVEFPDSPFGYAQVSDEHLEEVGS